MKRQSRKGFTLIELLVVVAIIALLIAILIPSLGRAKELSNRSACGASLTGILKAISLYSASNTDQFPVILSAGGTGATYVSPSTTGPLGISTTTTAVLQGYYNASSYVAGDPMACLWVLVLSGNVVSPKQFICKSDPAAPTPCDATDTTGAYYDSFGQSGGNPVHEAYSYSIAYPWVNGTGAAGAYWHNTVDATLPLVSDIAPLNGSGANPIKNTAIAQNGAGAPKVYNSNNHSGGEGQNVVFADTHVEFTTSPYIGQSGDNIWTTGLGGSSQVPIPSQGVMVVGQTNSIPYDLIFVPVRNATSNTQ